MKKKIAIFILFILCYPCIFSEEPPIESGGWYWDGGISLNGKYFYNVSDSYCEDDGYAYLEGFGTIHYWLYNTYRYHDGDGRQIINRYVPKWIENMGYVIDFDNIQYVNPNNVLASSVKSLMMQRDADVSVAFINDSYSPHVVINCYDSEKDVYYSYIYILIKIN